MPTIDERLRQVTLKIKRAKEHVADLEREVSAFLDTHPYVIATKRNPQTRQLIYYVSSLRDTPESLPLLAGDAIQNLVSALDHMAYQLVCCDTGDKPPNPNRIYFPIAEDAAKYEAKKRGKIEGASDDTVKAIDALKPYKGGKDLLWVLNRLNNIDKHRLLITVGSIFQSVNIGAHATAYMQRAVDADPANPFHGTVFPVLDLFLKPGDAPIPLKIGYEIFTDEPVAEVNQKMQFRFSVALYEPQISEAQSLVETLHQLVALVESIIAALKPRLK